MLILLVLNSNKKTHTHTHTHTHTKTKGMEPPTNGGGMEDSFSIGGDF